MLCAVVGSLSSVISAEPATREERHVAYSKRVGNTGDDLLMAASMIDCKNKIGEFEAFVLSAAYFSTYISGCGAPMMPEDKGDTWIVETLVGIGAAPGPTIIVEKKTGITYAAGKPKISDPKTYLKFLKVPIKK